MEIGLNLSGNNETIQHKKNPCCNTTGIFYEYAVSVTRLGTANIFNRMPGGFDFL